VIVGGGQSVWQNHGLPALHGLHGMSDVPSSLGSIHEVWGGMNTRAARSKIGQKVPLQRYNLMVEFDSPIMANTHLPKQKRPVSNQNTDSTE
jgi:hypothetical protein